MNRIKKPLGKATEKFDAASILAKGNSALRDERFAEAIDYYRAALSEQPGLSFIIRPNLEYAQSKVMDTDETSQHKLVQSSQPNLTTLPSVERYALVIHVYHLDTLKDLAAYTTHLPEFCDIFVTCPDFFSTAEIDLIKQNLPYAKIIRVPNANQDVGALMNLMTRVDFHDYGFICKIHTKQGKKSPVAWRQALLSGVLGDKIQVERTIEFFHENPALMIAGPMQLFLHGPSNLWKNSVTIRNYFGPLLGDFNFETRDWGFFAGTCFWIRTSILFKIKEQMDTFEDKHIHYVDDSTPAHAAEQVFGLLVAVTGGKVLLNDVTDPAKYKIETHGYPADAQRRRVLIEELSANIYDKPDNRGQLRGDLDISEKHPTITGWMALMGDPSPRKVILTIGQSKVETIASHFRPDLEKHGINKGRHAFSFPVPLPERDGKLKEIILIDEETSTIIAQKTCRWMAQKPDYIDFESFLKASMTQPVVEAPFSEADKQCFAVMEGIANRFCARTAALNEPPMVSVIMPVYNRAGIVADAVNSVLSQSYKNFELIVVDDGSTDYSITAVKEIRDERIRLIVLPENRGQSIARNAGLEAAQGKIIAYLDSDNAWDERYLAAVIGAFDSLPKADAIYSGILLYQGSDSSPFAVRYGHYHRALLENNNYIDMNIFSHRRVLMDRMNDFNQSLKRLEDYDFILRASEAGTLYSVPMLLCKYHYDKADNTVTNESRYMRQLELVHKHLQVRISEKLEAADHSGLEHPVAVIIPNWQSLQDIHECLDALCAKDWNGKLQIIVIDNASDRDVVDYLGTRESSGDIILIRNSQNYGFSYAVNQGIAQAPDDADILILNNDAIVRKGAIQALQKACYHLPDAGMTVPRQILPPDTKTIRIHVPYASEDNDCDVNISAHHRNIACLPIFHDGKAVEMTYAPFFAVYIRRDVISHIGMLDAEYGRHYRSDRVYCDMVRNVGKRKIYYVPEAFVIHKLQKATDQLRDTGGPNKEFDLMFCRNQWDKETAHQLGFRSAPWDTAADAEK